MTLLHLTTAARTAGRNPLRVYWEEVAGFGGHSPPQEAFHRAQERKRASVSANGIGKSVKGGAEAWAHLLGEHPYRSVPGKGSEGWVLLPSLKQGWKSVSKALRFLEPPDTLHPACRYDPEAGYTYKSKKILKIREELGGAFLVAKGGTQDLMEMEGDKIDWLWVDEPPKRSHWTGCRSRVDRTMGPMWCTFTPIGRPVGWLKTLLEGDEEAEIEAEPGWWVKHFGLNTANAPHLSPEKIQALIDGCDPWEIPQRIHAHWDGITGARRFQNFTQFNLLTPDLYPSSVDLVRIGMDHGEGITNQIGYVGGIVGTRRPVYYVFREFCPEDKGSTPDDVARAALATLRALDVHPSEVDRCFGDINSAGLLGGGRKYNRFIEQAFADELGVPECPFPVDVPGKKAGSVGMGESAMNTAMKQGRFFVDPSCTRLITAFKHYTGKERDLKNAVDGARYAFLDRLLSWGNAVPADLRIGR